MNKSEYEYQRGRLHGLKEGRRILGCCLADMSKEGELAKLVSDLETQLSGTTVVDEVEVIKAEYQSKARELVEELPFDLLYEDELYSDMEKLRELIKQKFNLED